MRSQGFLVVAISLALVGSFGCKKKSSSKAKDAGVTEAPVVRAPPTNTTVNEFLAQGIPTFVMGTQGDDRSDQIIAAQVAVARNIVIPSARMLDTVIKPGDLGSWPARPIVYGGSALNQVIDNLGDLPLTIAPGNLAIGGQEFQGPGFQLITVIPQQEGNPEFLFYAGTGTPGVAEINAVPHGKDAILVADAFGVLHTGEWIFDEAGRLQAKLSKASRRVEWREVEAQGAKIFFVADLEPGADEAKIVANCEKGVAIARKKLGLEDVQPISIYVYPDPKSKVSLTGIAGDGHARPELQTLHVVGTAGDALQHLVAHEATHLLAFTAFGQVGSALMGEGLAVWVSGQYAGTKISKFAKELGAPLVIGELMGPEFPRLPEREAYMHAGLAVQTAIEKVGFEEYAQEMYTATHSTWIAACEEAGTTMKDVQAAYVAKFPRKKKHH